MILGVFASRSFASFAEKGMKALLALARRIDALTERRPSGHLAGAGRHPDFGGQRAARYLLGASSNAWLEIQWYLFGAMFLLAAGYTLKHNGHVRIDIFYNRLSARAARPGSISSAACCSCCRWRCC
jgi:TRAP-type mannitol/chloroaromatic compound transport system permease small subunit